VRSAQHPQTGVHARPGNLKLVVCGSRSRRRAASWKPCCH